MPKTRHTYRIKHRNPEAAELRVIEYILGLGTLDPSAAIRASEARNRYYLENIRTLAITEHALAMRTKRLALLGDAEAAWDAELDWLGAQEALCEKWQTCLQICQDAAVVGAARKSRRRPLVGRRMRENGVRVSR